MWNELRFFKDLWRQNIFKFLYKKQKSLEFTCRKNLEWSECILHILAMKHDKIQKKNFCTNNLSRDYPYP